MNVQLLADRALLPMATASTRYLVVRIEAPDLVREGETRAPADVSFVLDRSGSMRGPKIGLARDAILDALGRLGVDDGFSVVAFDDVAEQVVHPVRAEGSAVEDARGEVGTVHARGSTNLLAGWLLGEAGVRSDAGAGRAKRVILLTDGRVNVGECNPSVLVDTIGRAAEAGVTTSALGVGNDFDEVLLNDLAASGRGGFVYLANADDIPAAMAREVGEAMDVVVRRPSVRVNVAGARVELLAAYPTRDDAGATVASLPDLTVRQQIDVVFALHLPPVETGVAVEVTLRGEGVVDATCAITLPTASAEVLASEAVDMGVLYAVAKRIAADARQQAVRAQYARNFGHAEAVIHAAIARVAGLGPLDRTLQEVLDALHGDAHQFSHRMESASLKMHASRSASELTDRTYEGTSRKWR